MSVSGSAVSLNDIEVVGVNMIFVIALLLSYGVGVMIGHFFFVKLRG